MTWTRQIIEGVTGIYTGSWHLSDPSPFLKAGTVPAKCKQSVYFIFILFYHRSCVFLNKLSKGNKSIKGTDNPYCNCTVVDKEHEATITKTGLDEYFNKLYKEVNKLLLFNQNFNLTWRSLKSNLFIRRITLILSVMNMKDEEYCCCVIQWMWSD